MATAQSVRPYSIRHGKAWCVECGRCRLIRLTGTSWWICPSCDVGRQVQDGTRVVTIAAGEILCDRCQRNALVAAPRTGELECPRCDTPPWERDQVGQPAQQQLQLLALGATRPAARGEGAPDGSDPPDDVVRQCFYCQQVCWHRAVWRIGKWRWICDGCGNRLSASRTKVVRGNRRRGQG